MFSATGCSKLRARDQLNKGVQSYKNAKYEEAIESFKNAVALDPTLINAQLYLATAYEQQYIPGAETPDNNRMAEQAIAEYNNVLQKDPNNIIASRESPTFISSGRNSTMPRITTARRSKPIRTIPKPTTRSP